MAPARSSRSGGRVMKNVTGLDLVKGAGRLLGHAWRALRRGFSRVLPRPPKPATVRHIAGFRPQMNDRRTAEARDESEPAVRCRFRSLGCCASVSDQRRLPNLAIVNGARRNNGSQAGGAHAWSVKMAFGNGWSRKMAQPVGGACLGCLDEKPPVDLWAPTQGCHALLRSQGAKPLWRSPWRPARATSWSRPCGSRPGSTPLTIGRETGWSGCRW